MWEILRKSYRVAVSFICHEPQVSDPLKICDNSNLSKMASIVDRY